MPLVYGPSSSFCSWDVMGTRKEVGATRLQSIAVGAGLGACSPAILRTSSSCHRIHSTVFMPPVSHSGSFIVDYCSRCAPTYFWWKTAHCINKSVKLLHIGKMDGLCSPPQYTTCLAGRVAVSDMIVMWCFVIEMFKAAVSSLEGHVSLGRWGGFGLGTCISAT